MDVSLLYFDGCPSWHDAERNLLAALAEVGAPDVVVHRQLVDTVEEAERVGSLLGSPTILVNGRDPFAVLGATPGLSCRVYRTDAGLAGVPTVAQLREALAAQAPHRP